MADSTLHAMTQNTNPATTDELYLLDDPGGTPANHRITAADLLKVINNLTADATPDRAADYVVTYDASASAAKKVLLQNVALANAAGTYTPTLSNTTNVAASAVTGPFTYMRVGPIVMATGNITIDPTLAAPTLTELGISLPIASNFGSATDASGTGGAQSTNTVGAVTANSTLDQVVLSFQATNTANTSWRVTFMYIVI